MNLSVSSLVCNDALEKNRYYVQSIAEMVQFLVLNELALRGTYDIDEHEEISLFQNLFKYTVKKDMKLSECVKAVPVNAKYTSPEIQNDVIQILAEIVSEDISNDINSADVPWFSILEDGTRDKNNRENVALGARYVKDGKVKESIIAIKTCSDLDAKTFADLTLKVLHDCNLDNSKILSQCYDGTSVMSGRKGGVQAILQKHLDRNIPYVHCCNHRLHLVIIKAINDVSEAKQFFDQCSMLYNFLRKGSIAKKYEGQSLVRLLEQRWSGHLHVTKIVYNNYKQILHTLEEVKLHRKQDGVNIAESTGLLMIMKTKSFKFCLIFLKRILETLDPANQLLQQYETSLTDSLRIVESTIDSLTSLRSEEIYEDILNIMSTEFVAEGEEEEMHSTKRRKTVTAKLSDYLIVETTGARSNIDEMLHLNLTEI